MSFVAVTVFHFTCNSNGCHYTEQVAPSPQGTGKRARQDVLSKLAEFGGWLVLSEEVQFCPECVGITTPPWLK